MPIPKYPIGYKPVNNPNYPFPKRPFVKTRDDLRAKERMKTDMKKQQEAFFKKIADGLKALKAGFSNESPKPTGLSLTIDHDRYRSASYQRLSDAPWLTSDSIAQAAANEDVVLSPITESTKSISLDEYTITMDQMPLGLSPEKFLAEMANDMNKAVGSSIFSNFSRFERRSSKPAKVGDIYDIQILGDAGSVMIVDIKSNYFIVQTVTTNNASDSPMQTGSHPVRGAREFGFDKNSDGSVTFYTRGFDRAESFLSRTVGPPAQTITWTSAYEAIGASLGLRGGFPRKDSFTVYKKTY